MEGKAKVVTTSEYYGEDWGDGCQLSKETIVFNFEDRSIKYTVKEDEPEDMMFGRSLEDVYSIEQMIKLAWELGSKGVKIEFESKEERD